MDEHSTDATEQSRFDIQRFYVKEQTCKIPQGAAVFKEEWKPEVQLEMNVKHEKLGPKEHEVVLRLSLVAKNQQRTAFSLEVQQAGIFLLENFTEEQLNFILQAHGPSILYPYARKVVADMVYAAGLPSINLAPINFEGLYHQQKQQAQSSSEQPEQSTAADMLATESSTSIQ
jgi:preprotein translocase subunit SecB